ncbi:hypothetical protein [Falsiroseomonas selenitidurans]|uniref:Uncharacterized protein n=1 Tax=Falsiroseomonas selenitidurans TaxID=2716335 RepID=A0ABX1E8C7_9PROT|nr:hypothetical protein [Falsiroseomonas selenitidurans]NKC32063.1 hypothetical protein [Falsiroseomonas selenitidurans]
MTNWTTDIGFRLALARLGGAIVASGRLGLIDARSIRWRASGGANLQGHANTLVPLSLLLAMTDKTLVRRVRRDTDLTRDMGRGSVESLNKSLRDDIGVAMSNLRSTQGSDIVAQEIKSKRNITVNKACDTYLSIAMGGSHARGGAGDTVVKRTLKIIAQFNMV